ncbi:MAG: AbrB/MazE/SpoVT family DNA-binding domain-containing protein [Clostridia bacterium]|nr:AbrB/MazE/SpoVT family DNA-binding domain-containing protein [Clostridia bacterium]
MKATGIVRRIDDLGRVVIPKEIRRTLRIREGEPLEIFLGEDNSIVLRKYSAVGEIEAFASAYAESLNKASGYPTCITDRQSVIAVSGVSKKDYLSKKLTSEVERAIDDRTTLISKEQRGSSIPLFEGSAGENLSSFVVTPIISHGDSVGSVIIFTSDSRNYIGDTETKLSQSAAAVLGKQLEQ